MRPPSSGQLGPEKDRLETHPKLSALRVKKKHVTSILKKENRMVGEAKVHQPEKYDAHIRLSREIQSTREHLKCSVLKDSRAKFFENADHDEIGHQLRGGDASTFTHAKPEFHCPMRFQISDAFSSVDAMMPDKWLETVHALSAICTQKPRIHTKASKGEKSLCQFSARMTRYHLQTGFTLSSHLEPSGPTSTRDIYLSRHLENRSTVHTWVVLLRSTIVNT